MEIKTTREIYDEFASNHYLSVFPEEMKWVAVDDIINLINELKQDITLPIVTKFMKELKEK